MRAVRALRPATRVVAPSGAKSFELPPPRLPLPQDLLFLLLTNLRFLLMLRLKLKELPYIGIHLPYIGAKMKEANSSTCRHMS